MKSLNQYITEGSWGYNPMDGDSPLDFRSELVDNLFTKIVNEFETALNGDKTSVGRVWDCIGVGMQFLEILSPKMVFLFENNRIENRFVNLCKNGFQYLRSQEEWLNGWSDKDKICKGIDKAENDLDKLVDKINKKYNKK